MRFHLFLKPESIRLEMRSDQLPPPDPELSAPRKLWYWKENILEELVDLLGATDQVTSTRKLYTDLLNREKRQTSGIGEEIAIPHVRTLRARTFVMGFARSRGLPFGSVDDEPVTLFFPMVAPQHDDRALRQVVRQLGEILQDPELKALLHTVDTPDEIVHALQTHSSW